MRAGSSLMTSWENTPSSQLRDISACRCSTESSATTPPCAARSLESTRAPRPRGCASCRGWPCRAGERADELPQHQCRRDVEPGLRLVEEDDRRIVQQRGGDHVFCLMPFEYDAIPWSAAPVRPNSSSSPSIFSSAAGGNLAEPSDQLEILAAGEKRIEVRLFRHVAEPWRNAIGIARTLRPSYSTRPDDGSTRPVSISRVVLLPDPFGPR